MPVYEYGCKDCGLNFDVVKSFKEYDLPQACQSCQSLETERYISRSSFYGANDWDKVQWNPALGCITKNSKHRAQIAREKGLIEVGNEDFDRTNTSQDKKLNDNIENETKDAYDSLIHGIKTEYLAKR